MYNDFYLLAYITKISENTLSCEIALSPDEVEITVADRDLWSSSEDNEFVVTAEEIIMHQFFGADNSISNDICLLKVPTLADHKLGF